MQDKNKETGNPIVSLKQNYGSNIEINKNASHETEEEEKSSPLLKKFRLSQYP
jgi:hypothetical protein